VFNMIDVDGNGVLDRTEFKRAYFVAALHPRSAPDPQWTARRTAVAMDKLSMNQLLLLKASVSRNELSSTHDAEAEDTVEHKRYSNCLLPVAGRQNAPTPVGGAAHGPLLCATASSTQQMSLYPRSFLLGSAGR
jgi:hypothetical protein